mgnify:CR=1 FL=1
METKDLILRKAEFDDWKAMYRNVWSHPETARYMMWRVTKTEEAARERIRRTIEFQREHDTFFVCEKRAGSRSVLPDGKNLRLIVSGRRVLPLDRSMWEEDMGSRS